MSGYLSYDDILNPKYKVCDVPLIVASETSTRDFGRFVDDFDQEEVCSVIFSLSSALEIRTKRLRAKVAPNSEKLGATIKSWGPSL